MAEWLKAAVLKTVKGESSSRVRIPLPPQSMGAVRRPFALWREASKLLCLREGFEKRNDAFRRVSWGREPNL